jgi:hypothetical protein
MIQTIVINRIKWITAGAVAGLILGAAGCAVATTRSGPSRPAEQGPPTPRVRPDPG